MDLIPSNVYTFTTKAPAILGNRFERMRLLSIATYDLAVQFRAVDDVHRSLLPLLGIGVPQSAKSLTYYIFRSETNEQIVLADIWLDTVTLVETIEANITVTIKSSLELDNIRKVLLSLGYKDIVIQVK